MTPGIAFDWGGIFTDGTFDADAVRNLSALLGVEEDRVAEYYYPLMEEFEAGAFSLEEFTARFREESGLSFAEASFRDTFLGSGRRREPMYRLLAAIPRHYRVGMLSNNVPVLCDSVREDPALARVDVFLFSNELRVRKPDPRAFDALCKAMGVTPDKITFIDDNPGNVAASRKLGFEAIHLTDFTTFRDEFSRLFPDVPWDTVDG